MEKIGWILQAAAIILALPGAQAQDEAVWPKEIPYTTGRVTIYQPQHDSLVGIHLYSRAAVSVTPTGKQPIFGAIWTTSTINTDRESRQISLEQVKVTDARFPEEIPQDKIQAFKRLLEEEIPKWTLHTTMDQLIATLDQQKKQISQTEKFSNDPPAIEFTSKPTILILFDGNPVFKPIENSNVQRAVNTPFMVFQDPGNHQYYIYGSGNWFTTSSVVTIPWKRTTDLPAAISGLQESIEKASTRQETDAGGSPGSEEGENVIPEIIVRTSPTELLQSNGEPQYAPVEGTNLLYMTNTDNLIFRSTVKQKVYVLISGRWYIASSLDGPWSYLPPENLPADFASIPEGSRADGALASVPGTAVATDAIKDAQIPQTAAVNRKEATCKVTYDGDPKFEQINGTLLYRAVNTESSVIRSGSEYFVCDNAVWFTGSTPEGPWTVATEIPKDIQNIPPENPAYNVKYVYIYESTPEVVYVGYLPGYMGCYVSGPVVIYGTGYRYPCWYGPFYYPRPITYGFNMHYNPWTGWSFGFSMSFGMPGGWFSVGFGGPMYHGGWWGPPVYRPPFYPPVNHFYGPRPVQYRNTTVNINNRNYYNRNNIYNDRRQGIQSGPQKRPAPTTLPGRDQKQVAPATRQAGNRPPANNVVTDRNGNVFRQNGNTWERNTGQNNWLPADKQQPAIRQKPATVQQPVNRQQPSSFDRNQLNQQIQNRDRGTQQNMNRGNFNPAMRGGSGATPAVHGGAAGVGRRK